MALPQPLTLSAEALVRLVAMENLGEPHVALRPPTVWRPRKDRDAFDEALRDHLASIGLFDRHGRVDVEVASSLAVLCRSGTEFYGWIHAENRTKAVLAAAVGKEGVLAVRDGEDVRLRQIGAKTLAEALVRQTADVPPGRGGAVSFLRSEAAAAVNGRRTSESGVRTMAAGREIRLAQRITSQPTTGGGQLFVACRDHIGPRRACQHPLRYADTPTGRWLNLMTPLPGGDNRILLAPASRADLASRLHEMHHALTR